MKKLLASLLVTSFIGSISNASTVVAYFADPSASPAAPDLVLNYTPTGQQVLAQWFWNSGILLPINLHLPLQNKVRSDIFMSMPWVSVGGSGLITFTDTANNPVMYVSFDKAVFSNGNRTFGASPAVGSHVKIWGPMMPTYTNAYFSFNLDRGGRLSRTMYGIDAGFTCGY